MSFAYIYYISILFFIFQHNVPIKKQRNVNNTNQPGWYSPLSWNIFLFCIWLNLKLAQRDNCIKRTSQFYQNKFTAWCFVCSKLYRAKYNSRDFSRKLAFTYYKQRWGHDKTGDFFLIWATQLFWLSHQENKEFIGGLVTNLLPGQLS